MAKDLLADLTLITVPPLATWASPIRNENQDQTLLKKNSMHSGLLVPNTGRTPGGVVRYATQRR